MREECVGSESKTLGYFFSETKADIYAFLEDADQWFAALEKTSGLTLSPTQRRVIYDGIEAFAMAQALRETSQHLLNGGHLV